MLPSIGVKSAGSGCGAAQGKQLGPAESHGQGHAGKGCPRTFWKTMTKDILTGSNGRGAPGWGQCVPVLRQGLSPGPGPRVCSSLCSGSHCSFGAAFGRAGPHWGVASAGLAQGSACAAMATRDAKLPLKSPNKQILHTTERKPLFSPCCPQPVFSLGTC